MALHKTGIVNKIKTVATSEKDFEAMKEKIITSNNLARCNRCGKLLAKVFANFISVKRKDVDIIAKVTELHVKCPVCQTCNTLTP